MRKGVYKILAVGEKVLPFSIRLTRDEKKVYTDDKGSLSSPERERDDFTYYIPHRETYREWPNTMFGRLCVSIRVSTRVVWNRGKGVREF